MGLLTAIRGAPPPRVAHSTRLGLLYLGTPAFFRRAAGSAVAPLFLVSPRPSGACFKGICTRLSGFPAPRRKRQRRAHPLLPYELVPRRPSSVEPNCGQQSERRPAAMRRITWFAVFLAKIKSCRQDFSCLSTGLASRFGLPCSADFLFEGARRDSKWDRDVIRPADDLEQAFPAISPPVRLIRRRCPPVASRATRCLCTDRTASPLPHAVDIVC